MTGIRHPVDHQIKDLGNRVVVGKDPTGFEQLAQYVIQRLDRIGGIDHSSYIRGVIEEDSLQIEPLAGREVRAAGEGKIVPFSVP